jgi:transposase
MSDLFGKSGELIIEALIKRVPGKQAAQLAQKRLRQRIPELEEALRFPLSNHYRDELRDRWRHYRFLKKEIERLDKKIRRRMRPYKVFLDRLDTLPGVGQRMAQYILCEIGIDLSKFPTGKHFANWIKICPGNNSSANKRKSGRNSKGNKYLKTYLVEAAWAAVKTKGCGLGDLYYRRCARLGKKKAIVSVAHKLARIIYTMLTKEMDYDEAYEDQSPSKLHVFKLHEKLKHFNNEELVTELRRRGVKEIVWHHEDPNKCLVV